MPADETAAGAQIDALRHFSRTYTQVIGTLNEGMLSSEFSLAEARVIYELAMSSEPTAKAIAQTLTMDQGYLSRILTRLEKSGLVGRKTSNEDARSSDLRLTRKGRVAFERLNALSNQQARSILEPLAPSERTRLVASMAAIEDLICGDPRNSRACVLRPHRPGDMGWIVHREAELYAEQFGWDETFEALAARIVADFITNFDARRERCWIAELRGEPVGHIVLVRHPDQTDTAKLRLLLVEPCARGKGVGRLLVDECLRFAKSVGYRRITLWTQSILVAAHRIYTAAGFRLVREEPHRSFGKDLIGQTWELDLT
jgi:DNA-binding MarR family transcriptional regulator/GNAT superfamily N-acetyltransferase